MSHTPPRLIAAFTTQYRNGRTTPLCGMSQGVRNRTSDLRPQHVGVAAELDRIVRPNHLPELHEKGILPRVYRGENGAPVQCLPRCILRYLDLVNHFRSG
jgi:hypothetical protein